MDGLLSWTGERIGKVKLRFRGEDYVSRALRNPSVRGCPVCLREDGGRPGTNPATGACMRGDWQFRDAMLCHRHPLVELWRADRFLIRSDSAARLAEMSNDLAEGRFDRHLVEPTPYDTLLDAQLDTCRDASWLGEVPVHAVTTFCRLLGARLLDLSTADIQDADETRHAALARGFSVAAQGTDAIRAALDDLAAQARGSQDEPRKAFGYLYSAFSQCLVDDPAFEVFRKILRDCVLSVWPIAQGEVLLGQIVPQRLLHSVRTASGETGSTPGLIEQFLIEAGAIAADDPRPHSRKTFDAGRHAALITEIPELVGPKAMCQAMGATQAEFNAVARDGVLLPRPHIPSVKFPWRISDALELVADVGTYAVGIALDDCEWESIQIASQRSRDLIAAIRAGEITLGVAEGGGGHHAFRLRREEVDALGRSKASVQPQPPVPGGMSAVEFARSVGIRDRAQFLALIAAGHVPAFRTLRPQTHREQWRMTAEDIAGFHENSRR